MAWHQKVRLGVGTDKYRFGLVATSSCTTSHKAPNPKTPMPHQPANPCDPFRIAGTSCSVFGTPSKPAYSHPLS